MLIDGKRVPAGAPIQGGWPTNINAIPSTLIQRVEVLSGGASSIYGSDAVAGVVNFIMNDRFEGVQLDWNYSGYNHQQNSWMGELVGQKAKTNPAQFQVPGDVELRRQHADLLRHDGQQLREREGQRDDLLRVAEPGCGPAEHTRLQRVLAVADARRGGEHADRTQS